jgi:putative chitinase
MHESAEFKYTREIGSDAYLSKYDTGTLAKRLGNTPEADGDGIKFCGRGLIQLTGHSNMLAFAKASGIDVIANPEYLETPEGAVHSACWFWKKNNLDKISNDLKAVTRRINGGLNGINERLAYFNRLKDV